MRVQIGEYLVQSWPGRFPAHLDQLRRLADLADEFGPGARQADDDESPLCITVSPQFQIWPTLLVTQQVSLDVAGFDAGVLIVPETGLVLIGAGERLLAYDLNRAERLWENHTEVGFWWWDRQGDMVLMAAELEFAAWDLHGQKLWSAWAEPPWSYSVQNGVIQLDVMDNLSSFPVSTGPT